MKIALGVSGGIAVYKSVELLRLLRKRGMSVQVVMTAAAQQFVQPLTFASLSGQKVITGMFDGYDSARESAVEHIAVAQEIEALVVAPATANILAKFAHGLADDFLSTLYLATKAPVLVAPAMNTNMWEHVATQQNLETLLRRGVHIAAPGAGELACGTSGAGRMAEPAEIAEALAALLQSGASLAGEKILITAGPTYEAIDPVRFLGNRSSGKMGYAIATEALRRGAQVTLVSGPTALPRPSGAEFLGVESADEMRAAVLAASPRASAVIMTAAVADYKPAQAAGQKIKRKGAMQLELQPTSDILAEAGRMRHEGQILIGFAAETENLRANARGKLAAKQIDAIVANDVSAAGLGFGSERNAGCILSATGEIEIPAMSKAEMAGRILDALAEMRRARGGVKP
jgi:phosphopantothenoylcysteine decarboxylase/phosphopantothenate--cysteine ligase